VMRVASYRRGSTAAAGRMAARLSARNAKLEMRMQGLIAALDPALREGVQRVLASDWRGTPFGNPRNWRPAMKLLAVSTIHDVSAVCRAEGVPLRDLKSLGEAPVLDAIIKCFDEGRWAGQTVAGVMSRLRVIYRILYGMTPPLLRVRTSYWVRSPRSRHRRQFSPAQYLEGAVAIAAIADFAEAAGQAARATAMRCDAALLAAASELHGRRGEYEASDICMVKHVDGAVPSIRFYWNADVRKNKKARVAEVREPSAVRLLEVFIGEKSDGPVFQLHGKGMTGEVVYNSIRRSTRLALGVYACPNSLRDAGASRSTDPEEMGNAVGSSARVTKKHYRASMAHTGLALLRGAWAEAAGQ